MKKSREIERNRKSDILEEKAIVSADIRYFISHQLSGGK